MIWRIIRKTMWLAGIALVTAGSSTVGFSEIQKETDMNPKVVQRDGFTVVGIAVRTSNAEQMTPARPIGKQWERLMGEGLLAAIPNKEDGKIVAVYLEYANDKDGEYTYLLGARVTKAENLPTGMVAKKVPAGRYAVFTSERGPVQKVIVDLWRRVWATQKNELGGDRTYKADFEVYDERARNPTDAVIDLFIGIR
jgi:predicted transcriptional regulator YdeE